MTTLHHAVRILQQNIRARREYARSCSGNWGDFGAGMLEMQLNAFLSGCGNSEPASIPAFLTPHYDKAVKLQDPDYVTYLELKKRFEK